MTIKKHIARFLWTLLIAFTPIGFCNLLGQTNSVLSEGTWVKMEFSEHGVYKIDRSTLSSMGFDINNIDPRNLAIFGLPGGMLPQDNASYSSLLLQELAIFVEGEDDGILNSEDYVLFYVDRVNHQDFNGNNYRVIKNLYSDNLYYYITVGSTPGKRIGSAPNLEGNFPQIDYYDKVIAHEEDVINILGSGREWYGERFDFQTPVSFSYPIETLEQSQNIDLTFTGVSQSFVGTGIDLTLNQESIGRINFNSIPDARYGIKGDERSGNFSIDAGSFSASTTLDLSATFDNAGANNAVGYINRFVLSIPTRLVYSSVPFTFSSKNSLNQNITAYQIGSSNSSTRIWDVTDVLEPTLQQTLSSNDLISFGTFSDTLHEFAVFSPDDTPLVSSFEPLPNQNLSGQEVPDLLIVTNELLKPQAQRLAEFRSANDGLQVTVVTTGELYTEFSAGRQDISAIRNYARFLKENNDRFRYLLMFGRGSYDYKDRIENNTNMVPTYEARNSLHPLLSFSSDDFFGFLDADEGTWAESSSGDHMLDIGVGRIPATTVEQATTAIDKIIDYQTSPQSLGDWRSRLVFVADDGDRNIHQRDADQLATLIDTTYADYNITKLYLDSFDQQRRPNGEFSPEAENALLDAVDEGALIINFTGHGAETGWMQERVLTLESIDEWNNNTKLPLLVTATCEFGRNDDPNIFSGAEKLIFKPDGGALAMVTTARPVFSSTNYDLNVAFYGSILEPVNGEYLRLGDIISFTKNNSLRGSLNRNFILLGDPSMRIAYPENQIRINTINNNTLNADEPDTLRALQHVSLTGSIESSGQVINNFNGILKFTLLDKDNTLQTKGTESDVFEFKERNSTLFSGSASVINGNFQLDFVVPKNINYQFGAGKMTFYATDLDLESDALGASVDFVLGGTSEDIVSDLTPPTVRPFLNDTSKVKAYFVKPDADLVLLLEDENGINVSTSGIGQDITATLNDSVTYSLNDFYTTDVDNFRKGTVNFPMRNLPVGTNKLNIKVWDTHNNVSNAILKFIVTDQNSASISEIKAYPNPFSNNMTFAVTHNSAGQSLELVVEIFNHKGEKVTSLYRVRQAASNTETITWNGTDNTGSSLPPGVYIYNTLLRSEDSKTVHSSRKKLIISN